MNFFYFRCRFCLKTIEANEKMALIDEEVKSQFTSLTEMKLDLTEGLSKVVCEVCLRSVQLATALKLQFIDNQKKLYSEIEDVQLEANTSKQIDPEIKIHDVQGSVNDSMQPVPVFVDISSPKKVPVKSKLKKPPAKKRKINPSSFNKNEENSFSMEPEINIKEEQFDEGEIEFNNHIFDQFNYTDPNPIDNNDSDDPSSMLQELEMPQIKPKKVLSKKPLTGEKVLPCGYCGKHYNKRHMSRHINVEHRKIKFPCVVPDCTSSYSRKEKLRNHIQAKHIDCSEEEYTELLEKVRTLMPTYENVDYADIENPKIKFYCVVANCQSNYSRKSMLKTHIADKHSDLSPDEMTRVMENFKALQPVYEMFEDQVNNPEEIN